MSLPFSKLPDKLPDTGLVGQYGAYIPAPGLVHAANTALGLGMPLLLTGEPGCGKSDFAWAAAKALGLKKPLCCQVRSDTRARDLLYHYDALVRFADAQAQVPRAREPRHYVSLRPLGVALMSPGRRQVVRIDEIDKAPRDLPNDLLLELDEGNFEIPELGEFDPKAPPIGDRKHVDIALRRDMERPDGVPRPLVIITSNAERQLPEPFLRRCVFFHISLPAKQEERMMVLRKILEGRFDHDKTVSPELLGTIATVFLALRDHSRDLIKAPTIAEMLRWTEALTQLYARRSVVDTLGDFLKALGGGGGKLPADKTPGWGDLPGLSCLIKHKDDLKTIGAYARDADPA